MNTALSWIKAYVPSLSCTDQEYCDRMTLTGTKVEGFERLDKNLEKIVVGQVLSIDKHPDADKLIVCQVDVGSEKLQIVTGAHNFKEGDMVPVVLDGGKVAGSAHDDGPNPENGIKIKAGKLRGVESFGMMCSIDELGASKDQYPEADENGIYVFVDQNVKPGDDAVEALGLKDTVFEYEITSNRVDCYSILGIAREAAVTFNKEFVPPVVSVKGNSEDVNDYVSVEVEATDLCPRYCARVVKNIKLAPSPKWLQRRLASSGIRPINNIVDITNYVMEEYGQPMHAFDYDLIEDHKIVVKRAKDGDEFVTLDGQVRKLDNDVLMICDGKKEIGIAGIMGGENSKITDDVKTMVFEAAVFDGVNIRKSAKRIGLRTDASGKFEKGLDIRNPIEAINRACQLIEEFGAGEVVGGVIDVHGEIPELTELDFMPDKYNALLGTDIPSDEMLKIFKQLEIVYNKDTNKLVIPSFRQDLVGQCDLAEEVARFYGYDKIPTTLPDCGGVTGKLSFKLRVEEKARQIAEFAGFSQGMCYSFESPKVFDKLLLPADAKERAAITISNPLGEDFSIMRTISLNGMLTSLATNYNRRNKDVRLYELGNIYIADELPLKDLPDERMQFTLGFYGDGDFFTMKGVVEEFLNAVGITDDITYEPGNRTYLHPGRQAEIIYNNKKLGYLGEVHPAVLENYDINKNNRTYVAVIDMPEVMPLVTFDRKFEAIAKFPAVKRDLSMVVPKEVLAGEIQALIKKRGGKILESIELFDVYEGDQIEQGFKSLAYSITFRAKDRTLEENDVTSAMNKILNGLEGLGIKLRE